MPTKHETEAILFEHEILGKMLCLHEKGDIKHKKYLGCDECFCDRLAEICKKHELLSLVSQKFVFIEDILILVFRLRDVIKKKNKDKGLSPGVSSVNDITKFSTKLLHILQDHGFRDILMSEDGAAVSLDIKNVDTVLGSFINTNYGEEPVASNNNGAKQFFDYLTSGSFVPPDRMRRRKTYFVVIGRNYPAGIEKLDNLTIINPNEL